jgi:hypothetical protein
VAAILQNLTAGPKLVVSPGRKELASCFEEANARIAESVVKVISPTNDVWSRAVTESISPTTYNVRVYFYLELAELTDVDGGVSRGVTEGNCLGSDSRRTLLQA